MTASRLALAALAVSVAGPTVAADPVTDRLNKTIAATFTAADGKPFGLDRLKDAKAVTVVFLSFDCPVSNSYSAPLTELARDYADRGVAVLGVVPGEPAAGLAKLAADYKLGFPLLADPDLSAAGAFRATVTPEAFVLDHNRVLRYRGRIDDAYLARLKRNARVTSTDLKDALDAVLAGKDVEKPATVAVGCPVGPRERTAQAGDGPTFHRDVLPILQAHCQGCHRPGQVGPFSLTTYKQAVNWADDIVSYTKSREMPPWKPAGGPAYKNDRRMPDKDIATLAAWVAAGCPEGDKAHAPPPPAFPDGWKYGPPDLVLTVDDDFHVGPAGKDIFRCFVLPTGLTEDRFIVGYEVKPGNPRVVHHTLNFWDRTGQARELARKAKAKADPQAADRGPGYSTAMGIGFFAPPQTDRPDVPGMGGFGGWAPGQQPVQLPAGNAYLLPKGADVVIQTHYHRTGKPEVDRLQIGLYFAKEPPKKQWQAITVAGIRPALFQLRPAIPAGKSDHVVKGSAWLETPADIHNVMPHMHLIGKSVKVTMTVPGREPVLLVDVPKWDYNWQETYWFREPLRVPAGTRLDVEAVYDNSRSNPNNPFDPPRDIYFGEETTNEMLFGFLGATAVDKGRVRVSRTPPKESPVKPAAQTGNDTERTPQ